MADPWILTAGHCQFIHPGDDAHLHRAVAPLQAVSSARQVGYKPQDKGHGDPDKGHNDHDRR